MRHSHIHMYKLVTSNISRNKYPLIVQACVCLCVCVCVCLWVCTHCVRLISKMRSLGVEGGCVCDAFFSYIHFRLLILILSFVALTCFFSSFYLSDIHICCRFRSTCTSLVVAFAFAFLTTSTITLHGISGGFLHTTTSTAHPHTTLLLQWVCARVYCGPMRFPALVVLRVLRTGLRPVIS